MSRKVNTSFQGSSTYQCERDSPTLKTVIENAVGDTALAGDLLTGDNSPPAASTNAHNGLDGGGRYRGALLGVPLVNQAFLGSSLASGTLYDLSSTDDEGIVWVIAQPIYLPDGETQIVCDLILSQAGAELPAVFLTVKDTTSSFATVVGPVRMQRSLTDEGLSRYQAKVSGLTSSTKYILCVEDGIPAADSPADILIHWCVHFGRMARRSEPLQAPPDHRNITGALSPPVTRVSDAGGDAFVMALQNVDTALLADNAPLHAWLTTRLNRNQNNLDEYLTGAPVGGGAVYGLVDSDAGGNDPTVTAFHDHSQGGSNKANEPAVDFPIWGEAFGPIKSDGTAPFNFPNPSTPGVPTTGMTKWYAPGLGTMAQTVLATIPLYMPDFPATSGTSKLKMLVLVSSPDNSTWGSAAHGAAGAHIDVAVKVDMRNSSGTSAGTASASVTRLGTSSRFGLASVTAIPFNPDQLNELDLSFDAANVTKNLQGNGQDFVVLGAHLYFDP